MLGSQADRGVLRLVGNAAGGRELLAWRQVHGESLRFAGALQQLGAIPGERVAVLGQASADFVIAVRGIWAAGLTLTVLPTATVWQDQPTYVAAVQKLLELLQPHWIICDPEHEELATEISPNRARVHTFACLTTPLRRPRSSDHFEDPGPDRHRVALLQFTSGSIGQPKGVMVSEGALIANTSACYTAGGCEEGDTMLSWLPLHHDMGLVGYLALPMFGGLNLVQATPRDFLLRPKNWMQWVSDYRCTSTAGPNFAWALAARGLRRQQDLDLSSLQMALFGAELVNPQTVREFVAAAAKHGLDRRAIFPAYGMAEVGIGATFPPLMRGLILDSIDRIQLQEHGRAVPVDAKTGSPDSDAVEMVLVGSPLPGLQSRVAKPGTTNPLPERYVGELLIRGTSVAAGYFNAADTTSDAFLNGWFRTGDLAYCVGTEIVICGRIDDLIIVGGRNLSPYDIERAVEELPQIRTGTVAAVGVTTATGIKPSLVVNRRFCDASLHDSIRSCVIRQVGVPPHEIYFTDRPLPRTTSGKLRRSACRALIPQDPSTPACSRPAPVANAGAR